MSKQPVFMTSLKKVSYAISKADKRYMHYGYAFGDSGKEKILESMRALFSDNESLSVSKIANELRSHETGKMPGGANSAINAVIKEINRTRFIEQ